MTKEQDAMMGDTVTIRNPFIGRPRPEPGTGIVMVSLQLAMLFVEYAFLLVCTVLSQLWIVLLLWVGYLFFYHGSLLFQDALVLTLESYELFALYVNFLINNGNWLFNIMRPFIPIYNLWVYVNRLMTQLFWLVMTPTFVVYLIRKAIDLVPMVIPVILELFQVLLPLFVQFLPLLAQIVYALFTDTMINALVLLLRLFIRIILALVPIFPALVNLLAVVVTVVVEQLQEYFVIMVEIVTTILAAIIAFMSGFVADFMVVVNNIAADIASATALEWFDYLVIVLTRSVGFIVKVTIEFYKMVIGLVMDNLQRITDFVADLLVGLTTVIQPVAVMLAHAVATHLLELIELFEAIVQVIIDLVPMAFRVIKDLILSGLLTDLFLELVELVLQPHSPVILVSIFQKIAEVFQIVIYTVIDAIPVMLSFYIDLFIAELRIYQQVVAMPIFKKFVLAVVDFYAQAIPIVIIAVVDILGRAAVVIILRVVMESLVYFAVEALPVIVTLIKPMTEKLGEFVVTLLQAAVGTPSREGLLPLFLRILQSLLSGIPSVVFGFLGAIFKLLTDIVFNESIFYSLLSIPVKIVDSVLKFAFGPVTDQISFFTVQQFLDLLFLVITPFFDLVSLITGATSNALFFLADADFSWLMAPITFFVSIFKVIVDTVFGNIVFMTILQAFQDAMGWLAQGVVFAMIPVMWIVRTFICVVDSTLCIFIAIWRECDIEAFSCIPYCYADNGCPVAQFTVIGG